MKAPTFKSLTDLLPVSLIMLDEQFNIIEMNTQAGSNFGVGKKAPQNLKDIKFYEPSGLPYAIEKCITKHFRQGTDLFAKSVLFKASGGKETLYFTHIALQQFQNRPIYICVFSDITSEIDCLTGIAGSLKPQAEYAARIIGQHEKIVELHRLIGLAADSNATVLITGESGTGKELVADAIHYASERAKKPFIKVNCSALSETLLESELFGHVKGSFTGAYKDKRGKFEEAHGGTIFLDEISEISQSLQVKLLRVVQEKTIERVGDNRTIKVDMRIVAATNKNLRDLIQKNEFREDLFYRLNVFPIQTIPLRSHKNDIPLLCNHFIKKFNASTGKHVNGIAKDAYRLLMDYCWPGNVRELENIIEHAFVVVSGNTIDIFDFPQELRVIAYRDGICKKENTTYVLPDKQEPHSEPIKKTKSGRLNITATQLSEVLEKNGWNQSETAKELDISRVALWKKIKKFGIDT